MPVVWYFYCAWVGSGDCEIHDAVCSINRRAATCCYDSTAGAQATEIIVKLLVTENCS